MDCTHFGECGSCLLSGSYQYTLECKTQKGKELFSELYSDAFSIYPSDEQAFRARAEYRIFHKGDKIHYAMHSLKKSLFLVHECLIPLTIIQETMPKLIYHLGTKEILKRKLFAIEFLSGLSQELLVTLIYHKKLDEEWQEVAQTLASKLGIKIIGRSRGQKVVLNEDFIIEKLPIHNQTFSFKHTEASFTQPNPKVNIKMIEWAIEHSKSFGGDLLELYCGAGNFTLPLAQNFGKVLATEISKTSIQSALFNTQINNTTNILFARLSAEEMTQALNKERAFTRLKGIDLDSYNFTTLFVDPPRAGLDETTAKLAQEFENIIYISCNVETLRRDLEQLLQTHTLKQFAFFDQFAYTWHLESGVILQKK